jgi:spore maturation protein CgeB
VAQVVDERADLPPLFAEGEEVAVFDEPATLRQLVRDLLQDPPGAERLAQAARRRALAEHTYVHRLHLLLEQAEADA